jgi:hypothetical protein
LLGHQGAGDAAADDQGIARDVFGEGLTGRMLQAGKPRRMSAAQISMLGGIGIEIGNGAP